MLAVILLAFLSGCRLPQVSTANINISIIADGKTHQISVPAGSNVQDAIHIARIPLGDLDQSNPPLYFTLSDGDAVTLMRIREEFFTEQVAIPYENQVVRNESMPEGETRLIQPGVNGLKEITYRRVFQDEVEISNTIFKETTLQPSTPEIIMIGVQAAFAPLPIIGSLVYLAGGNAWIMEASTANRRPLVTSGDLDGRIFKLSPSGDWLLFTRTSTKPADQEINTLWVVSTGNQTPVPVNLKVSNIVHYANWVPGKAYQIAYSTVEPRATAPGWQANNDLNFVSFYPGGGAADPEEVLQPNSGGIYGWWGTTFAWSPTGLHLAYARPDSVGLLDIETGTLTPLIEISPLQTHSDWAWIPGIAWGSDSKTLFVVTHAPATGPVSVEESPNFDLTGLSLVNNTNVRLALQTGMFAYPTASPLRASSPEKVYRLAYLQAIFPIQSEVSRYRIVVMDRDGSNRQVLFPEGGLPGLDPQTLVWSPGIPETGGDFLAAIYQGNLWLIDTISGEAFQITGDGLIRRIDWM